MKHGLILYGVTLLVMAVMDLAWIGGIAREFYKARIGEALEFHLLPAVLFYLMYVAGIMVFVSGDAPSWRHTMIYGALFGWVAYATYDLTNMATLRDWSWSLTVVDIVYGGFTTAVAATAGWLVAGMAD